MMKPQALLAVRRHVPRHEGFTLVELLVTMVVMAVLLAVAVPSFNSFIAGQKVKTTSYDLTVAMVMARSEAVKRNIDVVVAPDTVNTWTSGWTVKAGTITLQQQQAITGVTITKGPATVTYKSTGRPSATSNFEVAGATAVKCIKVDTSGIPTTSSTACP